MNPISRTPLRTSFTRAYLDELQSLMGQLADEDIDQAIGIIERAAADGKRIFIIGNGGSAATASHFACDLAKGTVADLHDEHESRLRIISLTDNVAHMTAIGNDLSYDEVFSQQLANLLEAGDVLIAFSASGNSPNIIKAVKLARSRQATVFGLSGFSGGALRELAHHCIHIPSSRYGPVEDMHLVLAHIISCSIAERKKGK